MCPRHEQVLFGFILSAALFQIFERKQCGCLDYNLEDGDDYLTIKNSFVHLSSWIDDFPGDVQREVVATLCNGVMNDGDHLQVSIKVFDPEIVKSV